MDTYRISRIFPEDNRGIRQLDQLLENEGIERDQNLDYTVGLYDEEYHLVATGSCFRNTLRCLAVHSQHQGEGLLNQIVTHLVEYQCGRGNLHLFLYTKNSSARFFCDLGFYEIARVKDRLVFLENRRDGFGSYLERLKEESQNAFGRQGAIVMNANPFTLGHLHLIGQAAAACDTLHLFLVSEEASLVPFPVRKELVKRGTNHLPNLIFHETGDYIISSATFPSYFLKDGDVVTTSQAILDVTVFLRIADALKITDRFAGQEPFSRVTAIYNEIMAKELSAGGIRFCEIPRLETEGEPISASRVRNLIHQGRLEDIKNLVPESTYRYFLSEEGTETVSRIKKAQDVTHH